MKRSFALDDIRRILMADWDPVGVRNEPMAADEYDSHAREIQAMLSDEATVSQLAAYLANAESGMMGLAPDTARTAIVAGKLAALKPA